MSVVVDWEGVLADFCQVAQLAGVHIVRDDLVLDVSRAPHMPPLALEVGKMAVYVFMYGETCLKVGKVGPRSHARYVSQHYNANSSKSNLAKSLVAQPERVGAVALNDESVGEWIKQNTTRVNVLLSFEKGVLTLSLLEVFLQCRLDPMFEGFLSQRP